MIINIFPLKTSHRGKVRGKEFLGMVELTPDGLKIECYDIILKEKLKDLFSTALIVRRPIFENEEIFCHKEEVVKPFTKEFFREILFVLHKHGLHGEIEDRK